jgi:lysine 2,3-aminomutase
MGIPRDEELSADPFDLADPVGEAVRQPVPFVVRKHEDRAILVVTSRCHFYCRFCFRRAFPGGEHRDPTRAELETAVAWLEAEAGIREIILSGGDPLVLSDERLEEIARRIGRAPRVTSLRVHTRAPVHHPARVTSGLVRALRAGPPVRVVTHFNHAVELTPESTAAVRLLREAGMEVMNQSVLLAGVNDDVESLADLVRGLLARGVRPYYLHHPDRTPGNAAFRVSISRGRRLHAALGDALPGQALPEHVIDLPDGSGKVRVADLEPVAGGRWRARGGVVLDDLASD